jgi:formylmethanofuran dehydrogenase subunit B
MYRFFKGQLSYRIAFWFIIAMFVMIAYPGTGFPEPAQKSLDRSATLTISGKTADYILIGERHFTVTEAIVIIDMKGKKIRLSDLAVPCEAVIEYRLIMDENPLALKITVKKLLEGATTRWTASDSEG